MRRTSLFASIATAIVIACALTPLRADAQDDDAVDAQNALAIARALGISGDDTRPDDQFRVPLFGRPLILGGEIEGAGQWRKDYALDPAVDDDDLRLNPETKLEATWLLNERVIAFAQAKLSASSTVYAEDGDRDSEGGAELNEAWVLATGLFGGKFALQAGRQQYQDRREWWWNEDLDSLRLHYFNTSGDAFIGIGREFGSKSTFEKLDPENEDVLRVLAHATWRWRDRNQLEAYALHAQDRSHRDLPGAVVDEDRFDERDGNLTWFGIRARGRAKAGELGKFYYWADFAQVSGNQRVYASDDLGDGTRRITANRKRRVRGTAVDVGASLELPFASEPYLTLSYARGSADRNPTSAADRGFQQTGLQGNNGKYRGNSRFRYYGEVLRPELSNLSIATVAFGIPIRERWWIESIYHRYWQLSASDNVAGSRLDADPLGENRNLGQAFDVIVGFEAPPSWELELTAGAFRAGRAYGEKAGQWAGTFAFKVDYNF